MEYIIDGKDTIYIEELPAARVYVKLPRKKGRQWRKYYRLVFNFNKVYPYALETKRILTELDSTFVTDDYNWREKSAYVKEVQSHILHSYDDAVKKMTITQGALLMRLIDRETGINSYELVKMYKSGMAAGFWQGVARLFGGNMKINYDPKGIDAPTEELVKKWEDDEFEGLYYSIFWKYPPKTEIVSQTK